MVEKTIRLKIRKNSPVEAEDMARIVGEAAVEAVEAVGEVVSLAVVEIITQMPKQNKVMMSLYT